MVDTVRLSSADAKNVEIYDPDPTSHIRMRTVKLFTDGALGSWGAALLSPYADKPDASGIMRLPEEELNNVTREWWERGWGVVSLSRSPLVVHTERVACGTEHSCHWRPREQSGSRCF